MAVVVSPRVDVLLKEELARFRSELQTVRASFETVPDGRGGAPEDMLLKQHSFLSDSDLSSDGSDWEECILGHEGDEQEEQSVSAYPDAGELHHIVNGGRLRWQSGKVADQSVKMHPEVYAPKDLPTRQRARQFARSESSLRNAFGMLDHKLDQRTSFVSGANPNPNPNGQVLTDNTYSAKELAQEVLTERDAEQDEGFEENSNGPAREMALRIQQLLERRGGNMEIKDWAWLLDSSRQVSFQPMSPSEEQGLGDWGAEASTKGNAAEALSEGPLKQPKETQLGSEEAQAYLTKVLGSLIPAQRLTMLTSPEKTEAGNNKPVESPSVPSETPLQHSFKGRTVLCPPNGGISQAEHIRPSESSWQSPSAVGSSANPGHTADKYNPSLNPTKPLVPSEPPAQKGMRLPAAMVNHVAPLAPEDTSDAIDQHAGILEPVPTQDTEASEPAPRSKLAVVPSIRGGAVHKPAVAIRTPRDPPEGHQVREPQSVDLTRQETRADTGGSPSEAVAGPAMATEVGSGDEAGKVPQVGRNSQRAASEMEERVRTLEVLQRRTLELQEQKLQHEIEIQRKRAELALQSLTAEPGKLHQPAGPDTRAVSATGHANPAPLFPATALLARAREAAHEVVDAVSKLQSVDLPPSDETPPLPGTATPPVALSRQLATAVTDLKEMLDRKLGEFYAACASFHAASLQGAAQLAQAGQDKTGHLGSEQQAAAAQAMARQTAELDSLRQQVRGSHQAALQSPAFHTRAPLAPKPPSRARSRSSTASQSSKRGPQDVAAAAAELAFGLRELKPGEAGGIPQWPGLESAVDEAVRAVEGHGLERQLLVHAAHAKWRDLAAREDERASSAKAAVQALLGSAFDYDAAQKELELITRAAKGVPARAKVRAKDPAFQDLAFASAAAKRSDGWEASPPEHPSAQQAEEALFLERLRQDVDRRIAAAAALSTGMNVGAKRRRVGIALGPFGDRPDNLVAFTDNEPERGAKKPGARLADGKENRGIPPEGVGKLGGKSVGKAVSRRAQSRDEKVVTLRKVEIAFGHKVERPLAAQAKPAPARKRKESGDPGWLKRMSEPRRPLESPSGEGPGDPLRERGPLAGVPRRSTLRPGEMVHRPANAVRWPSPEPRRPKRGGIAQPIGAGFAGFAEGDNPVSRLVALAREAAAGVIAERLSESSCDELAERSEEARETDIAGAWEPRGAARQAPGGGVRLEETARELTDWLSEQVLAQLVERPYILDGLKASDSGAVSEASPGEEASGRDVPASRLSGGVSIDEELVRAVAADVIGEEVDRLCAEGQQRGAVQEEPGLNAEESATTLAEGKKGQEPLVSEALEQQKADLQEREPGEIGVRLGHGGIENSAQQPSSQQTEERIERAAEVRPVEAPATTEPSQSAFTSVTPPPPGGLPQAASRAPPPAVPQTGLPFPFLPGAHAAIGSQSVNGMNQPWPFFPFPYYFLPNGPFLPGAPFPNPFVNPGSEPGLRENRVAAAQTEPQAMPQPKPVRVTRRKKRGGSPATPPTPSTPSSSPEVTLVSRRAARRGFDAALEGMGISVQLVGQLEAGPGVMLQAESDALAGNSGREDGPEEVGAKEANDVGIGKEQSANGEGETLSSGAAEQRSGRGEGEDLPPAVRREVEQEGGVPEPEPSSASALPKEDGLAHPATPTVAPSTEAQKNAPSEGSPEQPVPAGDVGAASAPKPQKSPGARARRRWAFLDERWNARRAVETMARSLLAGAAEESSSRSGGSTAGGGGASGTVTESTSVSFGEVVAGLASEPSTTFSGLAPGQEGGGVPRETKHEAAATSSLSEGEAEPGDLRQDQEPGQRGRVAPPELSDDSEPGLIRQQAAQDEGSWGGVPRGGRHVQHEDVNTSSESNGMRIRGTFSARARKSERSPRGSQRPGPDKNVIRNAVATLRSLAKAQPAGNASEGELESGAEEGQFEARALEVGEIRT